MSADVELQFEQYVERLAIVEIDGGGSALAARRIALADVREEDRRSVIMLVKERGFLS